MKQILVRVEVKDRDSGSVQHLTLEKSADDTEIEVLASGISTLFLKSKDALRIAENRRPVRIGLARPAKRRRS